MSILLDLVYIAVGLPWFLYGVIWQRKYREGYAEKLLGRVPVRNGGRPCAWFHAVSVGEVNLLQPLLERFNADFPGWDCVISTTTQSGYELARKKYSGHSVCYCPLDFSWAVRVALRRIRPRLLVLAELELWPNLIKFAKRSGCHVAVVNGRLSEKSFRGYRHVRWMFSPLLKQVDLIAAQNDEYSQRFRELLGADDTGRLGVTGSVKFDGAPLDRHSEATLRLKKLACIRDDEIVFIAGSTQEPEEELALEAFQKCREAFPQLRLLIAPRHITRCDDIAAMLNRAGVVWQRRTSLELNGSKIMAPVLLIDTIGELTAWWGLSHVAFVGGSMGSRGGQNMIEPAGYGAAVCFGPNTRNFRDIVRMLLQNDAAQVVHDGDELTAFVRRCLEDPQWASELGERARQLVISQQGAADRTMRLLKAVA